MTGLQGFVHQQLPDRQGLRIAALQLAYFRGSPLRKLFTGALQGAPLRIQLFHRCQRRGLEAVGVGPIFLLDHRHQHPEVGAPIPIMVLAQHLMAQEFQHPGYGVADHRRAHGAHMQLLGQIGAGIVHDDTLGVGRRFHPATRVRQGALQLGQQRGILDA